MKSEKGPRTYLRLTTYLRFSRHQLRIWTQLGPVTEALVQKYDDWEEWGLEELLESLRKHTERNPLPETSSRNQDVKKPVGSNQGNLWRSSK